MRHNIVVSCSDNYLWALPIFVKQMQTYWINLHDNVDITIVGYTPPDMKLPTGFKFYSITQPQYNKSMWVDGMLKFLESYNQNNFVLMLEDYWLSRAVNTNAVDLLFELMDGDTDILRVDLTGDRLYADCMSDFGYYNYLDIIKTFGGQYQVSLQAAIWNRKLLVDLLDELPMDLHSIWDVELTGTSIANAHPEWLVYGTRQWPVRYVNGMKNESSEINFIGFRDKEIDALKNLIPENLRSKINV